MRPSELFRLLLVVASLIAGLAAGTMMHASPAAATSASPASHTRLWWDGDTCRAFTAWERKPTARRLASLDRDGQHADYYLAVDTGLLYRAVRHHRPAHLYVADVTLDCAGSFPWPADGSSSW